MDELDERIAEYRRQLIEFVRRRLPRPDRDSSSDFVQEALLEAQERAELVRAADAQADVGLADGCFEVREDGQCEPQAAEARSPARNATKRGRARRRAGCRSGTFTGGIGRTERADAADQSGPRATHGPPAPEPSSCEFTPAGRSTKSGGRPGEADRPYYRSFNGGYRNLRSPVSSPLPIWRDGIVGANPIAADAIVFSPFRRPPRSMSRSRLLAQPMTRRQVNTARGRSRLRSSPHRIEAQRRFCPFSRPFCHGSTLSFSSHHQEAAMSPLPLRWSKSIRRRRRPISRNARLLLQALEDRTVPATFTVTNTSDSGAGTLRDAIAQANANTGADAIVFDPNVFNASSGNQSILLLSALPTIADDLTMTGRDRRWLRFSRNRRRHSATSSWVAQVVCPWSYRE